MYIKLCNTLSGQIKGSHRATNLIMPSHQGNEGIIDDNALAKFLNSGGFNDLSIYIVRPNLFDCGIQFSHKFANLDYGIKYAQKQYRSQKSLLLNLYLYLYCLIITGF